MLEVEKGFLAVKHHLVPDSGARRGCVREIGDIEPCAASTPRERARGSESGILDGIGRIDATLETMSR